MNASTVGLFGNSPFTITINEMRRWVLLFLVCIAPGVVFGSAPEAVQVGHFSAMKAGDPLRDWEPLTFDNIDAHTRYTLVTDDGITVLRADSSASVSSLVRHIKIDPFAYPMLTWRWKVNNIIEKGGVTRKSEDDFAARIYITFAEDPGALSFFQRAKMAAVKMIYGITPPACALIYVWGNRAKVNSVHLNPHTDRAQMIVVESGSDSLNKWRSVRRNIVEDFRKAFGTDPLYISGVAVMTDTDNTQSSAIAWYGDIIFTK
jgi:hypothetical protein